MGSRRFLDEIQALLYANLGLPGWDEVGLLVLCIHAADGAQADSYAHQELLAELNPSKLPEARLLFSALAGRELDFPTDRLGKWLRIAIAAALIHRVAELPVLLRGAERLHDEGCRLLKEFIQSEEPAKPEDSMTRFLNLTQEEDQPCPSFIEEAPKRWQSPLTGDTLDNLPDQDKERYSALARTYSLLLLAESSGWLAFNQDMSSASSVRCPKLNDAALRWLQPQMKEVLYWRVPEEKKTWPRLPIITPVGSEVDLLLPETGAFLDSVLRWLPVDLWLAQGESSDGLRFGRMLASQPAVIRILYPVKSVPCRGRLALSLYQALLVAESLSKGNKFNDFLRKRSDAELESKRQAERLLERMCSEGADSSLVLYSRSYARKRGGQLISAHPRSLTRAVLRAVSKTPEDKVVIRRRLTYLDALATTDLLRCHPSNMLKERLANLGLVDRWKSACRPIAAMALEQFCCRIAALDWFNEQAEDPDLMRRRGLQPRTPLPPEFGLFDNTGYIRERLSRDSVQQLRHWIDDDNAVLAWCFPERLSSEDDKDLREQLHILHHAEAGDDSRGQPWSPKAALDAVLADWPKDEPTRGVTVEAAERDLLAVLDPLFRAQDGAASAP